MVAYIPAPWRSRSHRIRARSREKQFVVEPWDTPDPEELDSGDARPPSQGVTKKAGRKNNA